MSTTQPWTKFKAHPLAFGSLLCLIGAFFYCYEFVLRILPGALEGELRIAFGNISAARFGEIAALYYVAYSPMQLPVGMLMDRFGPRRLLTLACLCCTIGSFMFSYSTALTIVGFGRLLVGFGSSFGFVGLLALAFRWLPKRFFSLTVGLGTTLSMLGLVYGEIKITQLAASMGLQYVLLLMVMIGLGLTVMTYALVRDGKNDSDTHTSAFLPFFKSVGQVVISRDVWLIGIMGACLYTSLSVFGELWGKSYLEQVHHLSSIDAAKAIACLFLGWALGAPIAGYFSDRTGRRVFPLLAGAVLSFFCIGLVLYMPGLSFYSLSVLLFLYGVFSGTEIIVFIMAKEHSGAALSATVFAVTNMIVSFGGMFFQPLVGHLLDMTGSYPMALSLIPVSLLLVIVLSLWVKDVCRD